ncbi:MAG: heparinase II/III domain-containing protein, partial [Terriglobales bacterium]
TYSAQAGDNIEAMPLGTCIDAAYPSEIVPYFQLMDSYSQAVAYNALDYRLNENAAALDLSRRAMLTMTKWKTWTPRRFDSHGMQTYYEVGVATQLVALGYDLIADQLSAQEKSEVEQAFWTKVIAPTVQEYFIADRDPIAASNWMANSLGGALAAAIAVAGDVPEWKQRDGTAVGELESAFERLIYGLFPGDGTEAEPLGYENFALQGLSWGTSALAALGIKPQGTDRMLEGFWWPYYTTVAPGLQLDTGDFNGHLTKLPGFAWGAEHSGIPELRAYYDKNAGRPDLSRGAPVGNNGHFLEEMPGPLDLVCCTGSATSFAEPPPSRVFPERGSAVLRSGWDSDSTVISLRAGPWFNHEHHDQGSFQVAAFGERLIDEAGYAHYYLDPRYPDYFTQAPGHNTVLVDGNPFSQQATNGRYWPGFVHPEITSQLLSPEFDYVSADLTSAYDGTLQSYRREYFFLSPGVLVVRDRIHAATPHVYSWLLHAPPGAQLTNGTGTASIQMPHASAALLALGRNAHWLTDNAPLPISVFEDLDKPRIPARPELVLTSAKSQSTQFLVAMEFVRGSASDAQMEQWTDANGVGVRTRGPHAASIIFRTGPGTLRAGDFTTDGSALSVADGNSEWSAIEALTVQEGTRTLVRSTSPVDLAMAERNGSTELTVHDVSADSLEIHWPNAPKQVMVDGKTISVKYQGNAFVLQLAPGEHHVSIQ